MPRRAARAGCPCTPLLPNLSGLLKIVLWHFSFLYSVTALHFLNEPNLQNEKDVAGSTSDSTCLSMSNQLSVPVLLCPWIKDCICSGACLCFVLYCLYLQGTVASMPRVGSTSNIHFTKTRLYIHLFKKVRFS